MVADLEMKVRPQAESAFTDLADNLPLGNGVPFFHLSGIQMTVAAGIAVTVVDGDPVALLIMEFVGRYCAGSRAEHWCSFFVGDVDAGVELFFFCEGVDVFTENSDNITTDRPNSRKSVSRCLRDKVKRYAAIEKIHRAFRFSFGYGLES